LQKLFNNLSKLIREEIAQYRELLRLLYHERESIRKNSLNDIRHCTKMKETLTLKLKIMEESRNALLARIADHYEMKKEDLTVRKIAQIAPLPYAKEFRKYYEELMQLWGKIKELNTKNKAFVESSLLWVNTYMGFMNSLMNPNPVYLPTGKLKPSKAFKNRIIHKEV
jgi:flagellar biosynthesis/type III secretory pathway chaperone